MNGSPAPYALAIGQNPNNEAAIVVHYLDVRTATFGIMHGDNTVPVLQVAGPFYFGTRATNNFTSAALGNTFPMLALSPVSRVNAEYNTYSYDLNPAGNSPFGLLPPDPVKRFRMLHLQHQEYDTIDAEFSGIAQQTHCGQISVVMPTATGPLANPLRFRLGISGNEEIGLVSAFTQPAGTLQPSALMPAASLPGFLAGSGVVPFNQGTLAFDPNLGAEVLTNYGGFTIFPNQLPTGSTLHLVFREFGNSPCAGPCGFDITPGN